MYNKKKQKGSAYTYVKEAEWINKNEADDFKMMNALTNKSLNRYKPIIVNEITIEEVSNINKIINKKNRNRNKIKDIFEAEDTGIIIKNLITMRNKLTRQVGKMEEIIDEKLNVGEYGEYLKNVDKDTKKFIFKNIEKTNDEITAEVKEIMEYSDKVLEIETNENRNKKKDVSKEYIKYSIASALSWKYIDLSKHAIGILGDIMGMAYRIMENAGSKKVISVDKVCPFIKNILSPYLKKEDEEEFYKNIIIYGYNIRLRNILIYDKNKTYTGSKFLDTSWEGSYNNIREMIADAIKNRDSEKAQEFLVVILEDLFQQSYEVLRQIIEKYREYQKRKYKDKDKEIVENISKSLKKFGNLFRNSISAYFGLQNEKISAYGIDRADESNKAKPSQAKDAIIRVIGGATMITEISHLGPEYYPLNLSQSEEEIVKRLKKMIIDTPRMDRATGVELTMGGFILKENIGINSMRILREYMQRKKESKQKNVEYIDKILGRMRTGMHIADLNKMRARIERRLLEIKGGRDQTNRELRADVVVKYLGEEYRKIKEAEIENLAALQLIEDTIKKGMGKIDKGIIELRDEIFTKLGHYQIRGLIFKRMVEGLYNNLQSKYGGDIYSGEYLGKIEDEFARMDDEVMKKAARQRNEEGRIPSLAKNILENRVPERITVKNIKANKINKINKREVEKRLALPRIANDRDRTINVRDKKMIEKKEFWENVKKKLGGTTIYIPYVDIYGLELGYQHGIFDLVNCAIEGKIKDPLVGGEGHVIKGNLLDRKTLSRKIRARGEIMVANSESDIRDPKMWRCMLKKEINEMKKLGVEDLRRMIFKIFSSKSEYVSETPYIWPDTSMTKEKIILYCKMTFDSIDYYKCPLLTSRNRVVKKMSEVSGVI